MVEKLQNKHCFEDIFQRIHNSIAIYQDFVYLDKDIRYAPLAEQLNKTQKKVKEAEEIFIRNVMEALKEKSITIEITKPSLPSHIEITVEMTGELLNKLNDIETNTLESDISNKLGEIIEIMKNVLNELEYVLSLYRKIKDKTTG